MSAKLRNYWLLVEDDDNDFSLFCRACRQVLGHAPPLHRVEDGTAAQAFLSSTSEKPGLILSDIKMPQMNGFELLSWVRASEHLSATPFVMLSSSSLPGDVEQSQRLGADEYCVKPTDFDGLKLLVKRFASDWGAEKCGISVRIGTR